MSLGTRWDWSLTSQHKQSQVGLDTIRYWFL